MEKDILERIEFKQGNLTRRYDMKKKFFGAVCKCGGLAFWKSGYNYRKIHTDIYECDKCGKEIKDKSNRNIGLWDLSNKELQKEFLRIFKDFKSKKNDKKKLLNGVNEIKNVLLMKYILNKLDDEEIKKIGGIII